MKAQTFVIKSFSDVQRVYAYLGQHHGAAAGDGKPLVVRVDQRDEQRSHAQNRLMWLWFGQIEKSTGQHKDSVHTEMKKRFLIRLMRDGDADFNAMCESIAALKQTEPEQYEAIGRGVIHLVSTTRLSTKQFTEYLNQIEAFALAKLGIQLFVPEDLMWVMESRV